MQWRWAMAMGNGDNQFSYGSSIYALKVDFLYVSDIYNKRIHKFNQNFVLIKLLKLEYCPLEITVFNSELVVRSSDGATNFYDINSLNFNRKSTDVFGFNLSEIDSMFYHVQSKEVNCLDQNGHCIEKIQLDDDCNEYGKLVLFNNTLLMSSFYGQTLIKFQ